MPQLSAIHWLERNKKSYLSGVCQVNDMRHVLLLPDGLTVETRNHTLRIDPT